MSRKAAVLLCSLIAITLQASIPAIIIPDQAKEVEKIAADDLVELIQASTGKKPVIAKESQAVAGKKIYVGKTQKASKAGINTSSWDAEEWHIRALNADTLIITGGYPRGTIYGVYEFLERNLGVIWLDEWDTYVPKAKDVNWSKDLNLRGKPSFEVRCLYIYFGPPRPVQEKFRCRMRHNLIPVNTLGRTFDSTTTVAWKRGMRRPVGLPRVNHTFYDYTKDIPKDKENIFSWNATTKKRVRSKSPAGPGQICYSNPETLAWFTAKLKKFIDKDRAGLVSTEWPRYYMLCKNDNRNECQCPGCLALVKKYESQNGAQLHFTNLVARNIRKEYPEIRIVYDIYKKSSLPKNIVPESNVMFGIAFGPSYYPERPRDCNKDLFAPYNRKVKKLIESYVELGKKGGGTIIYDDYWILYEGQNRFPIDNSSMIAKNVQFYHKLGIPFLFAQCEDATNATFHALRIWLGYRMMNNANADPETEVRRFMNAYYGKAAPQMLAYRKLLQDGQAKLPSPLQIYPAAARPDMTPEFFRKAYAIFAQAEKNVKSSRIHLDRVHKEQLALDRARIELRKELKDPSLPSVETTLKRYEKEYTRVSKKYERRDVNRNGLKELAIFLNSVRADIPVPKEFNPAAIVADYAWPEFYADRRELGNVRVADPEAYGGFAYQPRGYQGKNQGIVFGIYTNIDIDNLPRRWLMRGATIPEQAVPQDEKYHWYFAGNTTLIPHCFIYLHAGWVLQQPLEKAYRDPKEYNNKVGVYVHLKVQGPNHVKGSTKPNRYLVDRVIICRADRDWPHPAGAAPLPAELKGRKVRAELSGTSLYHLKKIYDPASAVRCAVPFTNGREIVFRKAGQVKTCILQPDKVKADGAYHLYSLGKQKLTGGSVIKFGSNYWTSLGEYWTPAMKDREYEIFVSLRKDKSSSYVDRVFLVEPVK